MERLNRGHLVGCCQKSLHSPCPETTEQDVVGRTPCCSPWLPVQRGTLPMLMVCLTTHMLPHCPHRHLQLFCVPVMSPPLECQLHHQGNDPFYLVTAHTWPVCVCARAQSCLTLYDPMDCSLPGSSVHGISQARILEWVAISRGSSWPRDQTVSPALQADSLFTERPGKHLPVNT